MGHLLTNVRGATALFPDMLLGEELVGGQVEGWGEFKKSTAELKEAVISVVAMLNKHGRAEVYFGIGRINVPGTFDGDR